MICFALKSSRNGGRILESNTKNNNRGEAGNGNRNDKDCHRILHHPVGPGASPCWSTTLPPWPRAAANSGRGRATASFRQMVQEDKVERGADGSRSKYTITLKRDAGGTKARPARRQQLQRQSSDSAGPAPGGEPGHRRPEVPITAPIPRLTDGRRSIPLMEDHGVD